tara:strand:- start:190 stop:345 length:156 start_codon:yes stop_codon:yes gene_type:complete
LFKPRRTKSIIGTDILIKVNYINLKKVGVRFMAWLLLLNLEGKYKGDGCDK